MAATQLTDPLQRWQDMSLVCRQWILQDAAACTVWLVVTPLPAGEQLALLEQSFDALATVEPVTALHWQDALPPSLRDQMHPPAADFYQTLLNHAGPAAAGNALAELSASPFSLALIEEQTAQLMTVDLRRAQLWAETLPSLRARESAAQVIVLLMSETNPAAARAYRESGLPTEMYRAVAGAE